WVCCCPRPRDRLGMIVLIVSSSTFVLPSYNVTRSKCKVDELPPEGVKLRNGLAEPPRRCCCFGTLPRCHRALRVCAKCGLPKFSTALCLCSRRDHTRSGDRTRSYF